MRMRTLLGWRKYNCKCRDLAPGTRCAGRNHAAELLGKLSGPTYFVLVSVFLHLVCDASCAEQRSDDIIFPRPSTAAESAMSADVSEHPNLGLLRMDICGPEYEDQIVLGNGGVHLMEHPWMALLQYENVNGFPFLCVGSVINERYVLTAAQCVIRGTGRYTLVSVRLGEKNLNSTIDCETDLHVDGLCAPAPQDIPVESVIPHPGYDGMRNSNFQNDIALVRLSRPADFSGDFVKPICLPTELSQLTEDLAGRRGTVSRWSEDGTDSSTIALRKWTVAVVPHPRCAELYRDRVSVSTASQLCADPIRDGASRCSGGDGGAPITFAGSSVRGDRRVVQHGLVSFGLARCHSTIPVVYTRVGHFMKWILDNIEP